MTRSSCRALCLCLVLSLAALACGSNNSTSPGPSKSSSWDQARVGNTGTRWWINAIKDKFFFSNQISPSEQDDTAGRAQLISITQAMIAKLNSGSTAASLVPQASDIAGGWIPDQDQGFTATNGPRTGTTLDQVTAFIDGGADPFFCTDTADPQKHCSALYQAQAFAWEIFMQSSGTSPYTLDVRVWQMASAADAARVYTDLLQYALYSPNSVTWVDCGTDPANPCPL